jgi:hypothetical protein
MIHILNIVRRTARLVRRDTDTDLDLRTQRAYPYINLDKLIFSYNKLLEIIY